MRIYQRYLSKSLIFFSILLITCLLFIESNMGFKWIFNLTNHFFIQLKVEKISGNWRNFLLEHVKYDVLGISIKADSIHIKLDMKSLFKKLTIFKEIQAKNLIILLKNNTSTNITKKNILDTIKKNNIFIKYPTIFKKIYIDQCLLKTSNINIFFFNVLTNMKLIHNNIILSSTYVDNINITSPKTISSSTILSEKNIVNQLYIIKKLIHTKKIYSFLRFFSNPSRIFIPLNLNLKYFNCKKINFLN